MNNRVRYTDLDISNMLDSDSDSDCKVIRDVRKTDGKVVTMTEMNRLEELDLLNTGTSKIKSTRNNGALHRLQNSATKSTRRNLDSFKEKNKSNNLQDLLIKKLEQKREKASMKIKLRRSTEQSNYKIYSDSDLESHKRKPLRSISRNVLEDNSTNSAAPTIKIKLGNDGKIISYEEHDVDNLKTVSSENKDVQEHSRAQTPNLRVRNSVNYNENKLFKKRQVSDETEPRKKIRQIDHRDDSNSDDSILLSEDEYVPNNTSMDHEDDTTSSNDSTLILSEDKDVQEYSRAQTPKLRVRNSVNYNENKLFKKRQVSDETEPRKKIRQIDHRDDTNSDDSILLSEDEYVPNNTSMGHEDDITSSNDSTLILSEDEDVQEYSRARTLNLRVRKSINYNENNLFKTMQVSDKVKRTRKVKRINHYRDDTNSDDSISTSSKDENMQNYSTLAKNMKRLNTSDNSNSDVATDKSYLRIKGSSSKVEETITMTPRSSKYSTSLTIKSISDNADILMLEKSATRKNKTPVNRNISQIDKDDSSDSVIFESITKRTFDEAALVKTPSSITKTPRRKSKDNCNKSINKNKCHAGISFDNTDVNLDTETNDAKYKLLKDCRVIIDKEDASILNRRQITTKDKSRQISTPKRKIVTSKVQTPTTPKVNSLTPSMKKRNAFIVKPSTPLHEARARLHVSVVPKSLPCREEEFNNIYTFLKGKLLDNSGGCMYISGVPGTGKTATVNEVIRCLRRMVTKRDLDNFEFVEINGMKLTEPRQAYVQILKQLTKKTATWEQAHRLLEKRFMEASSNKCMTLLLVDELDLLCNKRQDVVYNILDWPTKLSARLIVITIANTMDLPERVMMGRVTSRLGLTRLTFQPYNHKQLQEIVITRLKDSDAFRSEAVQLVARKIAAVSGDARRALDICRRATEIAELHDEEIVSIENINQALTEMIASVKVEAIRHCSKMEQIFLQAVCSEVARIGVEETSFKNVYKQLEDLCSFNGLKVPTVTQALTICGRLGANRLLICEHSRVDIYQRILLNVSSDDIHFSMQNIDI